jgi:hypothetical protein
VQQDVMGWASSMNGNQRECTLFCSESHFWKLLSPKIGSSCIDWAQESRFYLETESSIQNVVS